MNVRFKKFYPLFLVVFLALIQHICVCQYTPSLHFTSDDGLPSSQVYDAWQDGFGYFWFTTDRGVARFDGRNFQTFTLNTGLACETNFDISPASETTFWVNGMNGKLSFWDGNHFIPFRFNEKLSNEFHKKSTTWLKILDIKNNKIIFIIDENVFKCPKNYYSIDITTGLINEIYPNAEFELGQGVSDFIKYKFSKCFKVTDSQNEVMDSLVNNFSISEDLIATLVDKHSNYWLGTYTGLFYYNSQSKKKEQILTKTVVSMIYKQKKGGYWVCTLNDGVYYVPDTRVEYLNTESSSRMATKFARNKEDLYVRYAGNILYHVQGNKGGYLVSRINDLHKLNSVHKKVFNTVSCKNGKKIRYSTSGFGYCMEEIMDTIYAERALSCKIDSEGIAWVGTSSGLFKSNTLSNSNEFVKVPLAEESQGYRINDIEVGKSYLWLATISKGLVFLQKDTIAFVDDEREISHVVHGLWLEDDTTLWVATNRGLSRINYQVTSGKLKINSISNFDKTYGLLSNYVNDICFFENKLFVATSQGICFFEPSQLQNIPDAPKIFIKKVTSGSRIIKDLSRIPYMDGPIDISFEGVSLFRLPIEKSEFRYRLNKSTWVYSKEQVAHFSSLEPNKYFFEVQFRNLNSKWSRISSLDFTIIPKFYQTTWFQLLLFLLLAVIIWIWIRRINLENRLQTKYQEIELATLRSQINPHFIFNSLNTLQGFIFMDKREKANQFLWNFSQVIREALEYSRMKSITLQEEIDFISTYCELEKQRFFDRFTYQVNVQGVDNYSAVSVPPLMVQPLVENAVKHAFKEKKTVGKIIITYDLTTTHLIKIQIRDNGKGFDDKSKNHGKFQSLGLKIIQERLDLLNKKYKTKEGKIVINSSSNKGTTVILLIPIRKQEEGI